MARVHFWNEQVGRDENYQLDATKPYNENDDAVLLFTDFFGTPAGMIDPAVYYLSRYPFRNWHIKADINGVECGRDKIIDFEIEESLVSGEEFEVGTAIVSRLVIRLLTNAEIPTNAKVVPYVALSADGITDISGIDDYLHDGMTDWVPLGEFYVDTREKVNNTWEYTCYDKLMFANTPYVSSLTYPTTMQAVWDEICTQLGFDYDDSVVIGSYTIPVAPTGYSCRQVMAYIAGANGASVYVGKDGLIKFRRYASSDTPVWEITDADYITVKETGPAKTYTKVVVVYDTDEGLAYEAGSGDENHTLYVEIPFGTQTMADALLAQLSGFSFTPIQMDMRGYPQIEVGDRLRYGRPAPELTWNTADVAWQDADFSWDSYYDGAQSLALNMTFGFKGGLSLQIDAPAKSEQESEFGVDGSLTAAINRLNRNSVKKGKTYYGLTITDDEGLVLERSDHKSKITLNSDVQRWEVDGIPKLEYDALANKLKFTGDIIMEGGSISWSNVNAPDIDDIPNLSGRLTYIGPTGIYSGTIKTDQLIAGTAKISSALIDTIKANQIVVGDNGEKIGDGLIASAANWNGKTTLLTPTGIYTGTIQANQINAATLSAISANLGTVTAGTIQGVTISGGVITGATIQTSVTYPRIEMSGNDLFAYRDASNYIMIDPDGPSISAMSGSNVNFSLQHMTYGGMLQSFGYFIISADNGVSMQTPSVVEVPSWSQLRAANSLQDLQSAINQIWGSIADLWNALDGKADKGSLTGTAGPYNGGIPIGTNLMTSSGSVVTWSGIPAHSHVQS